jgi:hypothetical protein
MFYKQRDVEQAITCQLCSDLLQDPKTAALRRRTACPQCIRNLSKSGSEFNCTFCNKMHESYQKFPLNRALLKLIQATPGPADQDTQLAEQLRDKLAEMKRQYDQFERSIRAGLDEITEKCEQLRNEVDLATENLIEQVHEFSQQLMTEINLYEKDCAKSFKSKIGDFKAQFDSLAVKMNQFNDQSLQYLNEPDVYKPDHVTDLVNKASYFIQKLTVQERSLKSLSFNQGMLEFFSEQVQARVRFTSGSTRNASVLASRNSRV